MPLSSYRLKTNKIPPLANSGQILIRGSNDHINTRILQTMISGIVLAFGRFGSFCVGLWGSYY